MKVEQLLRYREQEIVELRAEVARLTKKLQETCRHGRRVEQAYRDGLLLGTWHCAHIAPSRAYAAHHGISQRRWQNACGLLRMVGVLDRNRHWTTGNLEYIERRLNLARTRALERPNEYKSWLNRHANNE